ncbi:hypothetical protein BVY03_06085 [bacterium K02(2017)]|nr:hypothetical protein BVY03_06085 [bacterium K02(2017)]
MDDKKLEKLFKDKKFLRSNDFVLAFKKAVLFLKENKNITFGLVAVLLLIGTAIPGFNWYQEKQVLKFNQKLFEAQKSLKKEELYKDLLQNYKNMKSVQYVRLNLINNLLDHNETDKALSVINEGLQNTNKDIFTTLLVLKKIRILKEQKKYKEAAQIASNFHNKILDGFLNKFRMINADLFMLAGDKIAAKKIYQDLGDFAGVGADSSENLESNFDPAITNKAKDILLLMELGVL